MIERTVTISPRQYAALTLALRDAELDGWGPEGAVLHACRRAGIEPPTLGEKLKIVVDPKIVSLV